MTVAVATRVEGFTTLQQLVPALAFHAVFSVVGLELFRAAARMADAAKSGSTAGAATQAGA